MATLRQKMAAEFKVRELLEREEMAPPDRIEYGFTCIRLMWEAPRVALVVDIDEPPKDSAGNSAELDTSPRQG